MEVVVVVEEVVVVASSGELVAVAVAVAVAGLGSDGGPDGNESDMVLLWRGVYETTVGV